jgi:hypothetical protein
MKRRENNAPIARRITGVTTHQEAPVPEKHDRINGIRPRKRLRTLADLDGRTHAAQQAHRLVAQLEANLGGEAALSTAARELVQRAALLGAIAEDLEVSWLERKPADLTLYGCLADRQRRILETLGLRRVPRDINGRDLRPDQLEKLIDAVRS